MVPLEYSDLLRVHTEGVGMSGYLIEFVGASSLQGRHLFDLGKIYMEDIAI